MPRKWVLGLICLIVLVLFAGAVFTAIRLLSHQVVIPFGPSAGSSANQVIIDRAPGIPAQNPDLAWFTILETGFMVYMHKK